MNSYFAKFYIVIYIFDFIVQYMMAIQYSAQYFNVKWSNVVMEPSDYYEAPINKVLHFIRGVGLIKG
jgi:hypothetical protein